MTATPSPEALPSDAETAAGSQARRWARRVYDREQNILFVSHPQPTELGTREAIEGYFDEAVRFWRTHCEGRRTYFVIDYDNLTTNLDELDFYAAQVRRVLDECVITVVRYQGGLLQRMASRMTAIKLHEPSNTYASLEEALEVVRGLKRGTISVQPPEP